MFLCALVVEEFRLIEGQIEATGREIDQLVYELYGLIEDEIKIVERETST